MGGLIWMPGNPHTRNFSSPARAGRTLPTDPRRIRHCGMCHAHGARPIRVLVTVPETQRDERMVLKGQCVMAP
jgi:hypothetical protein